MSEDTKLTENQRAERISLFPDWAVEKGLTLGDLINDPEYKAAYEEWAKNNPDMQRAYRAFANGVAKPLADQTAALKRTLESMTKPFANQAIELQKMINSVARPLADQTAALKRTLDSVTMPLANQAIGLQQKSVTDDPGDIATLSNTLPSLIEAPIDIEPAHLPVVDAIYETSEQMNQEIRSVKHSIEEIRFDIRTKSPSRLDKILKWVTAIATVIGAAAAVTTLIVLL